MFLSVLQLVHKSIKKVYFVHKIGLIGLIKGGGGINTAAAKKKCFLDVFSETDQINMIL